MVHDIWRMAEAVFQISIYSIILFYLEDYIIQSFHLVVQINFDPELSPLHFNNPLTQAESS